MAPHETIQQVDIADREFGTKYIPDPLEGVMEGETRLQRYQKFTKVLEDIWPQYGENSGSYAEDFFRARDHAAGNFDAYSNISPYAVDLAHLDPDAFDVAVHNLGTPDYVRVRHVPPIFSTNGKVPLPVGGSCILETHAMRTATELQVGEHKSQLADFARAVVEMAPTITHISGAMLGGQKEGTVHFNESDMWISRLVGYGIPQDEAQQIVLGAYSRINEAVERRNKLINPLSTTIHVDFDELDLQPAIKSWFDEIGIRYDPSFRLSEVAYTYVGPNQLSLLKRALNIKIESGALTPEQIAVAREMINTATHHARMKQVDHTRDSSGVPGSIVTGHRDLTDEERQRHKESYAFRTILALMRDVHRRREDSTSVVAGFADIPSGNSVMHETRSVGYRFSGLPGDPSHEASVHQQLTNPARLHRGNVDEHLEYLRAHLKDPSTKKELVEERIKNIAIAKNLGNDQDVRDAAVQKSAEVGEEIKKYRSLLPLSDNPYIQHAMQFLFDPDFARLIKEAVGAQQKYQTGKKEKNTEAQAEAQQGLYELCSQIYPKLEAYILYLYGRSDYPFEMRNSQILKVAATE